MRAKLTLTAVLTAAIVAVLVILLRPWQQATTRLPHRHVRAAGRRLRRLSSLGEALASGLFTGIFAVVGAFSFALGSYAAPV
ncbi:MAG: hypothetical protein JO321_15375 [Solirubrobacterales bacterium]|nr:hypothetical protein [Solirubrobacterales bacterium]MBV8940830.1 hypothetical protein [Solirubrobacterales bacterium]MBV9166808.1 hypothetical protein [Solirubrobacterales bacterium]MBV9536784.1 hypothetical protein [Solirubrobacterales bacterium]